MNHGRSTRTGWCTMSTKWQCFAWFAHTHATTENDRLCSVIGGCKNFRLDAVMAHQKSELHRWCTMSTKWQCFAWFAHTHATTENDRLCSVIGGCKNFRLDAVMAHQKSELHRRCTATDNAKKAKVRTTVAEKLVKMLNKHVFNHLTLLFHNPMLYNEDQTPIH